MPPCEVLMGDQVKDTRSSSQRTKRSTITGFERKSRRIASALTTESVKVSSHTPVLLPANRRVPARRSRAIVMKKVRLFHGSSTMFPVINSLHKSKPSQLALEQSKFV